MGTWSNKPFGNDTSLDWLVTLEDSDNGSEIIRHTLLSYSGYIEAPEAECIVAAAAIIAAGSKEDVSGIYRDAKRWIERTAFSPDKELKQIAMTLLERVLLDSELKALWEESGKLSGWVSEVNKISAILKENLEEAPIVRKAKEKRFPRSIGKLADLYLKNKDPKVEKKIVEKLSKIEDPNSQESITDYNLPLNLAAKVGIPEALHILIEQGADVNAVSKYGGYNALAYACAYCHAEATKVLLDNGANLFEAYPKYNREGDVVEERRVCAGILSASRKGTPDFIQLLVDYGADVREKDLNGDTLLHKAAQSGNFKLIDFLISCGLEVNQPKTMSDNKTSQGDSPLHYAVKNNQFLTAKALIDKGANVNALEYGIGSKFTWFNTPLDLLEGDETSELFKFLVSKGAVNSCDMKEPGKLLKLSR